jgi:hypothetical protein
MGRPGALLPAVLLALLVGCAADQPARPGALVERLCRFRALPPNAVQLEVELIERPAGDPYLNDDLWAITDEQVVDLECRATLEDNGFRVGQIVGMTPSGLQSLLTSPRACINRRRYLLGASESATLVLGTTVPHSSFRVMQEGEPVEVNLDQAQFGLLVTPTLTGDGRTRLHFTPQVQYGENLPDFSVALDGSGYPSGYVLEIKRPSRSYPALSWDVTLAPRQYMVLGTRLDRLDRLGSQCFLQPDGPVPVQRLLVVRTNRAAVTSEEDDGGASPRDDHAGHYPPPLALQATWPAESTRACLLGRNAHSTSLLSTADGDDLRLGHARAGADPQREFSQLADAGLP